ncbi:MAG TPA: OmpA family protein [Candidatus Methylomirabilis sp.]|nr:OmpA family protein [Candidatus Methylomirabilis sp.]HSB82396.1 OmpA family protein [Candidatus Methylomirabilis sp.]
MANAIRIGALFSVLLLLTVGCATKNYVRETLGTQQTQIDQHFSTLEGKVDEQSQRIGTLDGRVGEQTQRIEGVGTRVQTVETSVGEVGETAKVARDRADTAINKSDEVNSRLTRLWASRNTRNPAETIDVLFGFNQWDLTDRSQNTLATLAKELKENDKLVVELTGYADQIGPREYNIQLSERRVEAVRRFLVQNGVDMWRIQSVGMGPILDREVPKEKKRRVTVSLATLE